MKKDGIINGELAAALATLRHTDLFVVSDAGFPAGPRDRTIDLAVVPGLPGFGPVLHAILAEIAVEQSWIASEVTDVNPAQAAVLADMLPDALRVEHATLKDLAGPARFIVRTGEATPYSNVLIQAGYPFG